MILNESQLLYDHGGLITDIEHDDKIIVTSALTNKAPVVVFEKLSDTNEVLKIYRFQRRPLEHA